MHNVLSLRAKRGEVISNMKALVDKATGENRGPTPEEDTQYASLYAESEGLLKQIERAEQMEKLAAATAQPISDSGRTAEIVKDKDDKVEKGVGFARMVRSVAGGRKMGIPAHQFCKEHLKDDRVAKALQANTFASGGAVIPEDFRSELIEFLRPASVVRSLGAVELPLPSGNMTMPKQATGASATYIGEGTNIGVSEPTFGQLKLTARKLAALTPISNDLMRFASTAVDTLIRNDLVAAVAQAEDLNFIRGDGTGAGPRGLKYWTPAANIITANATVNLANVTVDLGKLWLALRNANSRMIRLGWIGAPRTENYFKTVRDGNGNYGFPDMANGRMILQGYPFRSTTQIPIDLAVTQTNESELYLVDFADAIVADVPGLAVDVSDTAAYHNGSAVVASFSLDQTVIRIIMEHDFGMRHAESVAYVKDVDWA